MARLRHEKARLGLLVALQTLRAFLLFCQIVLKARQCKALSTIFKSTLCLNNKYKEKHPQKSPFLPPFQMPFFDFHPSKFVMIFQ